MVDWISERLLDDIYDAATDQSLWSSVLVQIADATGSEGGVLFGVESRKEVVTFVHNGRLNPNSHEVYAARHFHNPWSGYMFAQPAGAIVPSDKIVPLNEFKRSGFYNDVLRPQGVARNLMIPLASKDDFRAAFNICRSERQGMFESDLLRAFAVLTPHLRRSMLLGFRIEGYQSLQRGEHHLLERLTAGVILLDRAASFIFVNHAARALNTDGGPLSLRNSKVATFSPSHTRKLDNLVQAALRGQPAGAMSLPRPDGGRTLTILVSSVRGRDVQRFHDAGMRDAAVLLYLVDPAARAATPLAWLIDAYDLTRAEARVALAAASGSAIAETADQLGLSANTVKTHLRGVFAKTGVGRQAELARLVASLSAIHSDDHK